MGPKTIFFDPCRKVPGGYSSGGSIGMSIFSTLISQEPSIKVIGEFLSHKDWYKAISLRLFSGSQSILQIWRLDTEAIRQVSNQILLTHSWRDMDWMRKHENIVSVQRERRRESRRDRSQNTHRTIVGRNVFLTVERTLWVQRASHCWVQGPSITYSAVKIRYPLKDSSVRLAGDMNEEEREQVHLWHQ